jgi:hypothetical protein
MRLAQSPRRSVAPDRTAGRPDCNEGVCTARSPRRSLKIPLTMQCALGREAGLYVIVSPMLFLSMTSGKAKASGTVLAVHSCECGATVPANLRNCPVCERDNGYPNVRAAALKTETEALYARLHTAEVSAAARKCLDILNNFGTAVLSSKAVLARSFGVLHDIVMSDNVAWVSYHKQVASGSRLPENNDWDRGRTAAESTILPNFHDQISFAAL